MLIFSRLGGYLSASCSNGRHSMSDQKQDTTGSLRLDGRYTNYLKIGHNAFEFLFDFGQFYRGNEKAAFHTRVVTNPVYAKAFLETLSQSIAQYETAFGPIPEIDEGEAPPN